LELLGLAGAYSLRLLTSLDIERYTIK
jgi:hypothetical protein